ncbi:PB1 domain-containing protein [Durusdinium trenchii]|uniref:PB1 domain-containing protein n=1 Tax=Durusdinium trenchii TaxID=1381693 RepID=A0ABP0K737_9DINO
MAEVTERTLKVSYRQEVRRLRDWPKEGESCCFENLRTSALQLFDLADEGQSLKYQEDTEKPLTAETFQAALEAGEALIRITIVPAESGESVSTGESTVESRVIEGTPFADGQVETQASGTSEASGWARFKEQVVTDFRANYQDMHGAVLGESTEATQARQVAGQVAGAVAGVVASARLIPLHGTRLCAKAVAAKAGCEAQEVVAEPVAAVPETPEPVGEVNRFKQQVFQDFETGRSEIQAAFGYFVGQERTPESQPRLGADVLPAVASTVAGLTVATTLVPLRAARLAVASLTKREGAEGGEGAQPDPTAQQAQPESATSQ